MENNVTTRQTRSALTDIFQTMTDHTPRIAFANIPDSLLTPSPDEQVINQRGRRSKQTVEDGSMLTFLEISNKCKSPLKSPFKSPFKSPLKRPNVTVRSSPRKRLRMDDDTVAHDDLPSPPLTPSPSKKGRAAGSATKRTRSSNLQASLSGLAKHQLVDLIIEMADVHPTLQQEINDRIPTPDLKDLKKCLNTLKQNIIKSMVWTKWGSSRDAFCYRRVTTHLTAFKNACVDQGKQLLDSQQYQSVIDYVVMAWEYVKNLPDWDSPTHNKLKQQCFKSLATFCMNALKKDKFSEDFYNEVEIKLNQCKTSSREIEPCIRVVVRCRDKMNK